MKEAGFLLTEQDKENNAIVKELVKNYFSLDNSSLEYFNRQIDNPLIDDVYFKAFEKAGSSKIEMDVPTYLQEKLDYGWQNIVKFNFEDFLTETGATYENFKSNKVEINKNFYKFKKAIVKFYIDKVFYRIHEEVNWYNQENPDVMNVEEFHNSFRVELLRDVSHQIGRSINHALYSYIEYLITYGEEDKEQRKNIEYLIERTVENIWIDAANNKLSSDNLKIVITFSFADWFLCSTNESWGSCLALTGNSANYWYGLPGLIGDKNRVMIYITRGDEKEYRGIKTHHYLYRTWALLDDKDRVNVVRWFPREDLHTLEMVDFLTKQTGLFFKTENLPHNHEFGSKHELELIWNTDGYSMFPYQDYTDWTEGDETYIISGDSGMLYKSNNDSYGNVMNEELYSYDAFSSLGDLIERNTTICDAEDDHCHCEICDYAMSQDETYITPNGDYLCNDCFHENYFECTDCGDIHHIDYSFYTEDGLVCEHCFHDNYFIDEIDSQTYPLDEAVSATDRRDGSREYLTTIKNIEKEGYIFNETDGIFYPPLYMIEIKGEWLHVDEVQEREQQLELELAV